MQEDLKVRIGANITGLNEALSKADRAVDRFATSVTRHAKRAAFAFAGLITAAAVIGAKFDKEMRFVGAITGATADEFEKLTEIAQEMGRTTEFTATQAAEGLRYLGMAGLTATQAIEALPGALDLATAGSLNLGRAADIATNVLAQFSLGVDQLSRVNDVLAKVQSTANTNIEQAAEAFIYGGTMASQMGMQVEELAGFVGLLANRGIKASLAGTTLRQSMIKLLNPSKEAAELMAKYNISVRDADGSLRNFTNVILDMVDANIDAQGASILLGARAGQLAAIFNMGSDAIIEYINQMRNAEGAAKTLAQSIRESFWGKWKEMISKTESMLLAFFKTFESTGLAAFNTVGLGMDKLRGWLVDNSEDVKQAFKNMFAIGVIAANTFYVAITKSMSAFAVLVKTYYRLDRMFAQRTLNKIGSNIGPKELGIYTEAQGHVKEADKAIKEWDEVGYALWETGEKSTDMIQKFLAKVDEGERAFVDHIKDRNRLLGQMYEGANITGYMTGGFKRDKGGAFTPEKIGTEQYMKDFQKKYKDVITEVNAEMDAQQISVMEVIDAWKEQEKIVPEILKKNAKAIKEYNVDQADSQELTELGTQSWFDYLDEVKNVGKTSKDISLTIASSFTDSFMNIIRGTKNVSDAFKDMAASIIADLMSIIVREKITVPLAGMLMKAFAFHDGGKVGYTHTKSRFVSPGLFRNAPRLHDGLDANEYPAILEKGETVTKKGGDVGGGRPNQVNVILQNPVFQDLNTQRMYMEQIATIVTARIAPAVVKRNYDNDGIMRSMVRGRT